MSSQNFVAVYVSQPDDLSAALTRSGLQCGIVQSSEELHQLMNRQRVDALIIEQNLPGFLSGLDILDRLKKQLLQPVSLLIDAVVWLGIRRTACIVMMSAVQKAQSGFDRGLSPELLQWYRTHSLLTASSAAAFAKLANNVSKDHAYTLALLQDLGILVMASQRPPYTPAFSVVFVRFPCCSSIGARSRNSGSLMPTPRPRSCSAGDCPPR